jgi:hypothetical protein
MSLLIREQRFFAGSGRTGSGFATRLEKVKMFVAKKVRNWKVGRITLQK